MTSVRKVLLETLAPAGGGKAQDRVAANPDGTLTVTPDAPDWGSPIDQLSLADSPTGFLEEEHGSRPNELFGKFTWRIDHFSKLSKRELRSHQFNVGEYKWYILVYPQGCDVCNHLSLFLCVADYDKLLPGWSHFAQFTIAVVNKDPKKSKYSDTLHRFCKKEHDWGWKKFMELGKVLDGFTLGDSLVIKAQVQVILDRPARPFRCLDAQYRRELVRVYLTNVEAICRRFCDEQRGRLAWLRGEAPGFCAWWRSLRGDAQRALTHGVAGGPILKGLVRQFFNEKEVTSTLVMDALFCGCKQLDRLGRGQDVLSEGAVPPCVVIDGGGSSFSFALDVLEVVGQLAREDWLPSSSNTKPLPLGAEGLSLRSGCDELCEVRRDALERDERRLAELGRRSVELYALTHIFTEQLERAYRHHQAEVRMRDLIAEEEAAGRLQGERAAARAAADREKRAKKKERQKAKKEAERCKRDAEAAEHTKQQQQQAVQAEGQAGLQQQEQHETEKLVAAAAGAAVERSSSKAVKSSRETHAFSDDGVAVGLRADQQQSNKQQAGPWAQRVSSSSAGAGSAGDSSSDSSSEDGSDSGSSGSSSKGFVPVARQQQRQHEAAAASQHGAGGWGATHNMHNQPPRQQQQQQASSLGNGLANAGSGCSGTSTPIGYAAAVAGMRPPPPAEVTAAAVAMAEQQRQLRELQEQAAALKQQVSVLEAAVRHRDALLAQRDQEAAELKQQLQQQAQQVQELRKQAADRRAAAAAAAAGSSTSSRSSGTADVKSFAAVAAAAAAADGGGLSNRGSRGSSRSRGASVDLSDAAAAAGSPALWSAKAAGTAVAGRPAAAAAAGSTSAPAAAAAGGERSASPPGELVGDLQQQIASSCSTDSAAEAAVSNAAVQHNATQVRPSSSSSGNTDGLDASAAAAAAVEAKRHSNSSSNASSLVQQAATGSSKHPPLVAVRADGDALPLTSGDGDALPSVQNVQDAAAGSMSSLDAPVSPRDLARCSIASAPGPIGSLSSIDDSTAVSSSNTSSSGGASSALPDKQQQQQRSSNASSGSSLPNPAVHLAGSSSSSSAEFSSRAGHVSSSASSEVLSSSMPEGLLGLAALRVSPAASRHGSFLSNGIAAAVVQCGSPLCGDGSPVQLTPSYSSSGGVGGEMAAAGAAAVQGPRSSSSKSKLGPGQQQQQQQQQQQPFAGFGSQAATSTHGMFGGLPASSKAAVAVGPVEDLAGFVHMHMIDDLLSGAE